MPSSAGSNLQTVSYNTAASRLPQTQYGSLRFPAEVIGRKFEGRVHVHEYSHVPGGSVEKLGRGLIKVTVRAPFEDRFNGFPGLYPDGLTQIANWAMNQATLPFVHPSGGSFPATIVNFDQQKTGKILSGEKLTLEFLEDQAAAFALNNITSSTNAGLSPAADNFASSIAANKASLQYSPGDLSLIDAINSTVNSILGYKDTAELVGNRYGAMVSRLIGQMSQLDNAISMQDARAWPVVSALRVLQGQAIQIQKDLQSQQMTLKTFIVPQTTSILQICVNLYGDASRQTELLANNNLTSPMRVPAGTPILYYPVTANQRASLNAA